MDDAAAVAARVLAARAHGPVSREAPIAPLTSYRLGGPAAVLFEPATPEDLAALAEAAGASGLEVLVVGRGSNMLVADGGFDGIAVRLGAGFRWTRREGDAVHAGAASPLPAVATFAMQHELTGIEFAVAIPASLGGAVAMNAGAHGGEIGDVLDRADVFSLADASLSRIAASDLSIAYRRTSLPPGSIVTGAVLRLVPGERAEIERAMTEAKEWRRANQPINLPNGGSVFKNPPGEAAGRLIERVCGKGLAVGGARISELHANFIVAERGARAADVYALMRRIQRSVAAETGVELELEIKLIGDFEEDSDADR